MDPKAPQDVAEAQAALLRDGALQFNLPMKAPEPTAPPWHPLAGFGSVDLVWALAAVAFALAVGMAVAYVRNRDAPAQEPAASPAEPDAPAVAPAAARLALDDADRLAAEGRFLDAARALLACGLDAIAERHPGLLRPTTTSRDIAREASLPEALRSGFARIARAVEKGLFGGRAIGAGDYADCRTAFVQAAFVGGGGPHGPAAAPGAAA